jgi:hypothetical protein
MGALLRVVGAFGLLGLLAAAPAAAGIYECRGRDGRVTYTGNPAACDGAVRSRAGGTPVAGTQDAASPPAAPAPRPAPAQPAARAAAEEAEAATWRRKREEAEAARSTLRGREQLFGGLVTRCNRGSDLYVEDVNGMRRRYSCDEARDEHEAAQKQLAEVERFLESGLADECRRAGCLPGWIR